MRRFGPLLYVPVAMLVIFTGLYAYARVIVGHPQWDHSAITTTWLGLSVGMALAGLARQAFAKNQRTRAVSGGMALGTGLVVYILRPFVSGHEVRLAVAIAIGVGAGLLLSAYVRRWRIPVH